MERMIGLLLLVFCCLQLVGGACRAEAQADVDASNILVAGVNNSDWDDFESDFDMTSSVSKDTAPQVLIADPFEPFNRGVFWFNDKLYFYMVKPVAKGLRVVVPRPARVSVKNFFFNLASPIRIGNCLLQLKFRDFGTEFYRFTINSTFGIAGLFDVAESYAGVKPVVEDFGQTLGAYGIGHGFYLVLPFVGPYSLRDATGSFLDSYADPLRYMGMDTIEYIGVKAGDVENQISLDNDTYEGVVRDSIDPYLFVRSAYAQRRLAQVGKRGYNLNILQGPLFDSDWLNPFNLFGVN
jgi:phospholipid-binding lipoprotein MlaA